MLKTRWGLIILVLIIYTGLVTAVSINELSITDVLNNDLSMHETIIISIENNTDGGFKLALPDKAYNILVNNNSANNTLYNETACEQCILNIVYDFPDIVINDTENLTFYRKIDLPTNATVFIYKVLLPDDNIIINNSGEYMIFPTPSNMTLNYFEWYYQNPSFPIDFGIRYRESIIPVVNQTENITITEKPKTYNENLTYTIVILIAFICILLIILVLRKKK